MNDQSTSSTDVAEVSLSKTVFSAHLDDLVKREYQRLATLVSRGEAIVRTGLAILTALVAVATFALGGKIHLHLCAGTLILVLLAAVLVVASLVFGLLTQSSPSNVSVTDSRTLDLMVGDKWESDPDPMYIVAVRNVKTIKSLRIANETRAKQGLVALWLQLGFMGVLLAAVIFEILWRNS